MVSSPFNPKTAMWEIAWPGRVARHDVIYLTPPCDPMQGIPLGNGDIGVLGWCEDTKLVMAVNKCDLWDDAAFGRFHNWKADEEESSTALRHACRLIVDFQAPVFDVFFLEEFTGRLGLADATMTLSAATPLGRVAVRAFVDHASGVFCCEVSSDLKENVPCHVIVERYGSRTFSHWYAQVNRDAALGLSGTEASVVDGLACLTHTLTTGAFAVGCGVAAKDGSAVECRREHSRSVRIAVTGKAAKKFDILLTVTPPLAALPIPAARRSLAAIRETGIPAASATHAGAWKDFWNRSLMEFGDDYLDNLWHLTQYYANASQRGAYPGRFANGLWGWNRDVQHWNFYFHWNQQQIYWPLNAAGHADLANAYLNYRFQALPCGRQDAREAFGVDGAVVSDVCERRGCNSASEFRNHTPVAQIAMDFWRQYRFTGDRDFLNTRALPYILEAARFFESLFERGEDGRFHAKSGTGYEGSVMLRDAITELVYGRVLFATALSALAEAGVEEPRAAAWRELLDHLAPLPTVKAGPELVDEAHGAWRLKRALFKGREIASDEVFAAGFGIKENRLLTSLVADDRPRNSPADPFEMVGAMERNTTPYTGIKDDLKCHDGIFPGVECSPVFPSGLIGLADRDSAAFQTAVSTANVFALARMGWDPLPIVLARLGLSEELAHVLALWPGRWQFFRNGFGHYGPRDIMKADAALRFRTTLVRDAARTDQAPFPFPAWPFRHMGMEAMSVLACAMNEALLQSHDGVIRIAPAAGRRNARFTLHAVDGFVVSAELENGEARWIGIVSRLGKTCLVENPWAGARLLIRGKEPRSLERGIVRFATRVDDVIMMLPADEQLAEWKTTFIAYDANRQSKTDAAGLAHLGLPRMF